MERIWRTYEDMNEIIYAADMDSHELLYLNKRARDMYGIISLDEIKGKMCYELLQNNAVPCAMCTNSRIGNGEVYRWEYYNQFLKKRFVLKDQMIIHDGRRVRVEIAKPVSNENEGHRYYDSDEVTVLINECMRMSLEQTDPEQGISKMLEYLGTALLGQRVYIFELSDNNEWNNTYEWCAYNVTAEIDNLQNIPYETTEIWNQEFERDHFVVIPDIEEMKESDPDVYEYLYPQNIHSIIVGPLYQDQKLCGFYGIDNPPRGRIEKVASMLKTIGHVIESMMEKRRLIKKLEELSYHDQMSKLGNRFALEKYLYSLDHKKSLGVVFCDVTGLKNINDTMGHSAGDRMLLLACSCMKDAFEGYELFRIGGDELLAIDSGITKERFKKHCAKLKSLMVENEFHLAMGCVWEAQVNGDPKELIDKADAFMYTDKRSYYEAMNSYLAPAEEMPGYSVVSHKFIDPLTGGYTRKGFIREAERIFAQDKNATRYAIIAVDIQKFKSINDIFGIAGGDKLLGYLHRMLMKENDRILVTGRLEADWFVCLIERGKLELNKLDKVLKFSWSYGGRTVEVGLRCGIYFVEDPSLPVNSMIEWAILAKQSTNRNAIHQFSIFDERMRLDYVSKAEILASFQRGMKDEEFKVYYQPIVQLSTNHVVAAEALVRWQHRHLGFISPGQFIPILESNGMITELDHYVLQKVDEYLERVEESNLPVFSVAINLSWQDFYDQKMVDDVIHIASDRCNANRRINFEVTETSLSALEQNCGYILKQFQECGSKVLLDDFGSGVSSLGMIGNYSFDVVKIDRSFICQIAESATIRSVIQSVIQMCHNLGLKVIGEGVETKTELDFLTEAKCDYIQGFYFAKPMPEKEFNRYVREHGSIDYSDRQVQLALARMNQPVLNEDFYKKVIDNVDKFVCVVNPEDYSLIYMNQTALNCKPGEYQGEKCYHRMEGLDKPCGHCVMKNLQYDKAQQITVGSGEIMMDVSASMWEVNGRKVFVEIGGEHTAESANDYAQQVKNIVEALPNQRCVFHLDITEDRMISVSGHSKRFDDIAIGTPVDTLIDSIAARVVDEPRRAVFGEWFNRSALLEAFAQGRFQFSQEFTMHCDTYSRRLRVTANLIRNRGNNHIECLLYGLDVSRERSATSGDPAEGDFFTMYQQADHDRRIDYLTGLRNRLDLNEQFEKLGERDFGVGTVYMIDIDDFKRINNRYGHLVGDQCLRRFGEMLEQYGEQKGITFFRYCGEEALGIDVEGKNKAAEVSRDILALVQNTVIETDNGDRISLTVSIGYTKKNDTIKKMIEYADKAMYVAKKKGKNCYASYSDKG